MVRVPIWLIMAHVFVMVAFNRIVSSSLGYIMGMIDLEGGNYELDIIK